MGGFEAVLKRYGKPISVFRNGEEQTGMAMVQPLFEKDGQWLPSPLGRRRTDRFLCLASPELSLERLGEEDFLMWDGTRYDVAATQKAELGNTALYQWAVLTPREEEGDPGKEESGM